MPTSPRAKSERRDIAVVVYRHCHAIVTLVALSRHGIVQSRLLWRRAGGDMFTHGSVSTWRRLPRTLFINIAMVTFVVCYEWYSSVGGRLAIRCLVVGTHVIEDITHSTLIRRDATSPDEDVIYHGYTVVTRWNITARLPGWRRRWTTASITAAIRHFGGAVWGAISLL